MLTQAFAKVKCFPLIMNLFNKKFQFLVNKQITNGSENNVQVINQ